MKQNHWDEVYTHKTDNELGWYENAPTQSLELIQRNIKKLTNLRILLTGAGTTTLAEPLIKLENQLIFNDISQAALSKLERRLLNLNSSQEHQYICGDLGDSELVLPSCDVWIDRAVLHFLLSEAQIKNYFNKLHNSVVIGGYVLIAEFTYGGASKCSGLPVKHYNLEEIQNYLGQDFSLVESFAYDYINPAGQIRPYIYTLFKRNI
jgi:hypothetical protein